MYCVVFCRIKDMFNHVNDRSGLKSPLIADDVFDIIMQVKKACVRLSIQFVSWCDIFVSCSSLTCAFLLFFRTLLVWTVK